jgi:hypothetical protein
VKLAARAVSDVVPDGSQRGVGRLCTDRLDCLDCLDREWRRRSLMRVGRPVPVLPTVWPAPPTIARHAVHTELGGETKMVGEGAAIE